MDTEGSSALAVEEIELMTVSDLDNMYTGYDVDLFVMVVSRKVLKKKNGDDYISLEVQDKTGKFEFPIWDIDSVKDVSLEPWDKVHIVGTLKFWNGAKQINEAVFKNVTEDNNVPEKHFYLPIPAYDVPQAVIDGILDTITNMAEPYKTIAIKSTGAFDDDPNMWKQFTTCVSAEKHHGNKLGGLVIHTYGVLKAINNMIKDYVEEPFFYDAKEIINVDRLRLKAILHDVMKVNEYEYDLIIQRKPDKKLGHLVEGIVYLNKINHLAGNILSEEDVDDISYSLISHHGQWSPYAPKSLEDDLLHLADMIDSRIGNYLD